MTQGRHRKPTDTLNLKKIALGSSVALGSAVVVPATFAAPASAATVDQWDRIAKCESDGLWNRPDGDGGRSSGGLQFQPASWNDAVAYLRSKGVDTSGFPQGPGHQAYKATKQQQIMAGEALLALQGASAWTCNAMSGYPLGSGSGASMFKGGPNPYPTGTATPTPTPTTPAPAPATQESKSRAEAAKVLALVNAERAKVGAKPLVADSGLNWYAYKWSRTQAHEGRMYHSDLSFSGSPRGENVAYGQDSAADVVQDWMDSPGHRKNILNPAYTRMGAGLHDDGQPYWTQVFAGGAVDSPPAQGEAPAPVEPPDAEDGVYVVKRGDYLVKIANLLKVDGGWQKLFQINKSKIKNPNLIYPGQKLSLPGHEAPSESPKVPPRPTTPPKPSTPPPAPETPPASSGYVMPVHGRIGQTLIVGAGGSMSRSAGGHSGLDITAPQGTPVVSVAAGTVVSKNASGAAYGNHVVVKHADGKYTLYAHLSATTVSVGQSVSAGQQVGNVGSTGNSSGPHLHFEVRTHPTAFLSGVFLEPKAYLRAHGVSI